MMTTTEEFDEQFKILLVGDSGVGKSSILMRYTENLFEDMPPTIGVDFKMKKMTLNGKRIKLTLWDTGQERFRTMTSAYYRGAHGAFFVFDVTRRETLETLRDEWLLELSNYTTHADIVKVVVGNKIDLEPRQVGNEEGVEFARSVGALYIESSAKTDLGINVAFETLVESILHTPSLCMGTFDSGLSQGHSTAVAVEIAKNWTPAKAKPSILRQDQGTAYGMVSASEVLRSLKIKEAAAVEP